MQRSIIQEMSEEVFAVELLLQEAFLSLPEPHLRWRIIKHVRCGYTTLYLELTSAVFLAEVSLRSPRKLFILSSQKTFLGSKYPINI